MLILIIIASLILLYSTWLQRKLKDKNLQLSEQIKKVEWGLVLSKELIRDNSNQYIQLEKVLNRYATLVPQQLFEEFRSLHHTQQIHYSEHLLFSLTNINSEFSRRLKQKHPNLTSNDILLASMLHYQWELDDIAHIFQTSLEAIQKRSVRLKTKLERKRTGHQKFRKIPFKNLKQLYDNTCPDIKRTKILKINRNILHQNYFVPVYVLMKYLLKVKLSPYFGKNFNSKILSKL